MKYKITLKLKGRLENAQNVFLLAFHHQYKAFHPIHDLKLKPPDNTDIQKNNTLSEKTKFALVDTFLRDAFKEEKARFEKAKENNGIVQNKHEYFVQLETEDKKVVGFASFQHNPETHHCYIHQLAIIPEHQGKGMGKKMVFALRELKIDPKLSSVALLTRRINQSAIAFYRHLGFNEVEYSKTAGNKPLNTTRYIQMNWQIA